MGLNILLSSKNARLKMHILNLTLYFQILHAHTQICIQKVAFINDVQNTPCKQCLPCDSSKVTYFWFIIHLPE